LYIGIVFVDNGNVIENLRIMYEEMMKSKEKRENGGSRDCE